MNQPTDKAKVDLVDLAKQGHPRAIATLINQVAQPQGVKVHVAYEQGCLSLWLVSDAAPDRHQWVPFLHQGLEKLNPATIDSAKIFGQLAETSEIVWAEKVLLTRQGSRRFEEDLSQHGNPSPLAQPEAQSDLMSSQRHPPSHPKPKSFQRSSAHLPTSSTSASLQAFMPIPFQVKRSTKPRPERRALRLAARKRFLSNTLAGLLVLLIGLPIILGAIILLEKL